MQINNLKMYNNTTTQKISSLLKSLLFVFIISTTFSITGQNDSSKTLITGKVLGKEKKALAQVSIMLKGTNYGTTTNSDGLFNLSIPNGIYVIEASFLGYKTQTKKLTVKGKLINLNFNLKETIESLNEVVINAYNPESIVLESKGATKSNMSIMNTPAPIVIVNRATLDQQGITNLQDAIRNISGVSQAGNNYNIGDNLIIRGLGANYTLDGMYSGAGNGNSYNPTRSITNVEKIEVLKGPATGLYGMGSAGGVINFVEKKPQFQEQGLAEFRVGQWNYYRAMVDYTAPISDKFAFRIVTASEGTEGFRDVSSERFESYGSLTFKSGIHNLTLSGAVIHDEGDIDAIGDPVKLITPGLVDNFDWTTLVNDNAVDVGTGAFLGVQLTDTQRQALANSLLSSDGISPYDIGDHSLITNIADPNEGKEYRVKLSYEIEPSKNFTIMNQLLYRTYSSEFTRQTGALNYAYYEQSGIIHNGVRSPLVENGVLYGLGARRQEYRHQKTSEKAFQYFGDFKYDWSLGNTKGEHLLSVNYENRALNYARWSAYDADGGGTIPYIYDITDANAIKAINGSFWDYDPVQKSKYDKSIAAYGIGFQEVIYLLDEKLTARLGGAYAGIKQEYENILSDLPVYDFNDTGFTYNLGMTFRPIDQLAVFGNYAKGRTAYSITGSINETDESNREDSEALSIDLGVRYKAKDNSLLASVVVFQTARTNIGYGNSEYDEVDNPNVPQFFYDREDRTEGVEVDINYFLNKKLSFNANATFQDPTTLTQDIISTEQTKGVPKTFARFWSEYKCFINDSNNPLLFNFGVRYEDERSIDGYGNTNAHINSYVVFDTGLGYNLNNKWNFRVNIDNVFNEEYYSKAMFAGGLPGATRNFELTAQYKF